MTASLIFADDLYRSEAIDAHVRSHLSQRLADYEVPRRIELVAELPRDDNGKLAKKKLRDQYWSQRERRV